MKAAFYQGNKSITIGSSQPQAPGPGEVRLEVAYCGICGTDLHIYLGHMDRRVKLPQIMGHEMSGVVAEVGAGVEQFRCGDRVVVRPLDPCGACPACRAGLRHICHRLKFLGIDTPGALQGSWTVPAPTLHRIPDTLPLEKAALIEPLAVACHDVRLGEVAAGDQVVVIGGGPIGMLIALVARQQGATLLVADINSSRVEFARRLGLDAVHPQQDDLPQLVERRSGGAGADVVFEVSGSAAGAAVMTELVRTRGRIVLVGIFARPAEVNLFRFFWREIRLCGARVYEPEDFERAIQLADAGALPLERLRSATVPLEEVPSIFQQMEAGADLMKVLVDTKGARR